MSERFATEMQALEVQLDKKIQDQIDTFVKQNEAAAASAATQAKGAAPQCFQIEPCVNSRDTKPQVPSRR